MDDFASVIPETGPVRPSFFDWSAIEAATGCTRERYYAMRADLLLVAGARLVAGYLASKRRQTKARYNAYCAGVATPATRRTRAQEQLDDARAFGLIRGAA